jgi:hypothetical protein
MAPHDMKKPGHLEERPYYTVRMSNGVSVECMMLIRALGLPFALANVVKYVWRAGKKTPNRLDDLKKAAVYLADEIRAIEQEEV